jgi:hypothetical protein
MITTDLNRELLIFKFSMIAKIFSSAMAEDLRFHTSRLSLISTQNLSVL